MFDPFSAALFGGGALASLIGGLSAKRPRLQQQPLYNPQTLQTLSQLQQLGLQGLQNPYEGFEPIAAQARKSFQEEGIPSLAERFTAFGGQGGQRSSAFQGALGRAQSDLDLGLAGLRSQYGMQNRAQALEMLGLGIKPTFGYTQTPGGQTPLSTILGSLGGGAMSLGTSGLLQGLLNPAQQAASQQPAEGAATTVARSLRGASMGSREMAEPMAAFAKPNYRGQTFTALTPQDNLPNNRLKNLISPFSAERTHLQMLLGGLR